MRSGVHVAHMSCYTDTFARICRDPFSQWLYKDREGREKWANRHGPFLLVQRKVTIIEVGTSGQQGKSGWLECSWALHPTWMVHVPYFGSPANLGSYFVFVGHLSASLKQALRNLKVPKDTRCKGNQLISGSGAPPILRDEVRRAFPG